MKYRARNAKESTILVLISKLSLPERFKRIKRLELSLKNAETDLARKQTKKSRTKKQATQRVADEDGIIELRYRLVLERAEYLAQKEISPDYVEPLASEE
jgi:hypothetical protein